MAQVHPALDRCAARLHRSLLSDYDNDPALTFFRPDLIL